MALRRFDPFGGNIYHNLSIFVSAAAVREDSGSTTPTTARRGIRFELLNGRREKKTKTKTKTKNKSQQITQITQIIKSVKSVTFDDDKENNR